MVFLGLLVAVICLSCGSTATIDVDPVDSIDAGHGSPVDAPYSADAASEVAIGVDAQPPPEYDKDLDASSTPDAP